MHPGPTPASSSAVPGPPAAAAFLDGKAVPLQTLVHDGLLDVVELRRSPRLRRPGPPQPDRSSGPGSHHCLGSSALDRPWRWPAAGHPCSSGSRNCRHMAAGGHVRRPPRTSFRHRLPRRSGAPSSSSSCCTHRLDRGPGGPALADNRRRAHLRGDTRVSRRSDRPARRSRDVWLLVFGNTPSSSSWCRPARASARPSPIGSCPGNGVVDLCTPSPNTGTMS